MYNCTINIRPASSTCVGKISWNSQTEVMCVFYIGNDQCYDYTDISWNDILDLESKALVLQSWGKALGKWKNERSIKFTLQARSGFDSMWDKLHESDKKLYVQWAKDAYLQDLGRAKLSKSSYKSS